MNRRLIALLLISLTVGCGSSGSAKAMRQLSACEAGELIRSAPSIYAVDGARTTINTERLRAITELWTRLTIVGADNVRKDALVVQGAFARAVELQAKGQSPEEIVAVLLSADVVSSADSVDAKLREIC